MHLRPDWKELVRMHHGSLDRTARDWVERGLKDGTVKACVCTSSLDLGVDFLPVETAAEMFDAVRRHIRRMDAAVFAAAVADYRPAEVSDQKINKTGETLMLELVRTTDILSSVRGDSGFTRSSTGSTALKMSGARGVMSSAIFR